MVGRDSQLGLAGLWAAVVLGALATPAAAAIDPYDGNWHFNLTPYVWLPNVNGSTDLPVNSLTNRQDVPLGTVRASAEMGPNDYLQNLQGAIMLTGEARKGAWSVFTDIIYMDFGNQDTHVRSLTGSDGRALNTFGVKTDTELSGTVWTLAGAYSVFHRSDSHLDVLAGFRYVGIDSSLKLNFNGNLDILDVSRKTSGDQEAWDGIVGFKGEVRFGDGQRWYVPYYADIGTGDSNWTWQALVGIGYAFDWGDINLSLRNLSYDFDKHDAHLRFTGPALGVSFHW